MIEHTFCASGSANGKKIKKNLKLKSNIPNPDKYNLYT